MSFLVFEKKSNRVEQTLRHQVGFILQRISEALANYMLGYREHWSTLVCQH